MFMNICLIAGLAGVGATVVHDAMMNPAEGKGLKTTNHF